MSNPAHYYGLTFLDYSKEKSSMQIHMHEITAVNIAASLTDMGTLRAAIEAITLGTVITERWIGDVTAFAQTLPASVEAQREKKWLVVYEDTVTFQRYSFEIPTADLSLLQTNTDLMIIASGAGATFVTELEQLAESPAGNPINVLEVRYVGRNL